VIACALGSLAQDDHLCVTARVVISQSSIVPCRNNLATSNENRADWRLSSDRCKLRLL
jgi:hypothetical protein